MSFDKKFNPSKIENIWYKRWEENNYFSPNYNSQDSYCIQLPPPNVTGTLHMGHAFQQTLMDTLIRLNRMKGLNTNWVVGTDHAGIATQILVEKQLKLRGINPKSLDRDKLIKEIWDWKIASGSKITEQMRRLGVSANWSFANESNDKSGYFTLDKKMSNTVVDVFVKLYNDGLIYKGKKLVNWDPEIGTAISDLEVTSREEKGFIWDIKYYSTDGNFHLSVSTTRPETLLGDVAVAVNPEDVRYKNFIGKYLKLPLTDRIIPIIADEYVDKDFGTGCVKITPAHDYNDYLIGEKHKLEKISIFDSKGFINSNAPKKYQGLNRFIARKEIISDLEKTNQLVAVKDHIIKIPRSERTGVIVEPMLTNQWFVKMKPLAEIGINVVKDGSIKFYPKQWENTYYRWLENIEDWCISRQLVWGHRIPVWYDVNNNYYVARNKKDAQKACKKSNEEEDLIQDPDVLDTWFSSGLVPFSSLGWPKNKKEIKYFLPSSVLITGFDIIFFWVARMIMLTKYFTDEIPFKDVYINALVRDADGQKMSKSKGNTIDPIDIIDGISHENLLSKSAEGLLLKDHQKKIENYIKKNFPNGIDSFGVDALRFTFCSLASFTRTLNFDLKRCEGYRNFCNKLWNASRFVLMNADANDNGFKKHTIEECASGSYLSFTFADKWIVSSLNKMLKDYTQSLTNYRFDLASNRIYHFVWNDFCDWYLELSKVQIQKGSAEEARATRRTMISVLEKILRLLHPITPFITEEIWQKISKLIPDNKDNSIMITPFPVYESKKIDLLSEQRLSFLKNITEKVRKIMGGAHANVEKKADLQIISKDLEFEIYKKYLVSLLNLNEIIFKKESELTEEELRDFILIEDIKIKIDFKLDLKKEKYRLEKEIDKFEKLHSISNSRLSNENFIKNAPKEIVKQEKERILKYSVKLESLLKQIKKFS